MTCYNLNMDFANILRYFRSRPNDVPAQQNDDHAFEIPMENLETLENPKGLKVPFRWPVFTILVSVIQWAIFSFAMEEEPSGWVFETFVFDHGKRHQIWRLLTHIFVHYSKTHLWCNLISQLLVGSSLEIVHGWKRIMILYFCSGLIGTLTQCTLYPLGDVLGASGAVYGLVGAHLSAVIMNWNESFDPLTDTVLAILDILLALLAPAIIFKYLKMGEKFAIGHAAHVGGVLGGSIVGVFVLKTFRKAHWKAKMSYVCFYIAAIWVVFLLGANFGQLILYRKFS